MMVFNYSYMVMLGPVSDAVCNNTEEVFKQTDFANEQELIIRLRTANIAEGCIVFGDGDMSFNSYFQRD